MYDYRRTVFGVLIVAGSALMVAPMAVQAQDAAALDELSLEELLSMPVEAATKTEITQLEVPQAITVVTREEIERTPAHNLADLLRATVGANVVRVQGSQNVLATRGSNVFAPAKILMLIDGQPIDPTIFSTTWWELVPVSIEDIERIEFVRSPGTIYGANAQNGVVNIITRRADLNADRRHALLVSSRGGDQSFRNGYAGYTGSIGSTSFRLSSEFTRLGAYATDQVREIIPGKKLSGEQTFKTTDTQLDVQNFSGSIFSNVSGAQLSSSFGVRRIRNAQGRLPDRLCFVGLDGSVAYANATASFEGGGATHRVTAGTNRVNFGFMRNSDSSPLDAELTVSTFRLQYEVQKSIGGNHNLLFGTEYGAESAANVGGTPFLVGNTVDRAPTFSAHAQYEWKTSDRNRFYFGGRASDHYVSGFTLAPMAAFVHKFNEKNTFRASTYTSYRYPNVFEHSMDYDQSQGKSGKATHMVSNQGLEAEKTTSYEVGFRSQPTSRLLVSIDAFVNKIDNGVEWALVGYMEDPMRPMYQSQNSLAQTVVGAELSARWILGRGLSFDGSAVVTDITNRSSAVEYGAGTGGGVNGVGEGRYGSEYVPPYVLNAAFTLRGGSLQGRVHYQYTAAHTWQWPSWKSSSLKDKLSLKPVPAYGQVNVSLGFEAMEGVRISVEGTNLLNELHTEWRGDKSIFGRNVWIGLSTTRLAW